MGSVKSEVGRPHQAFVFMYFSAGVFTIFSYADLKTCGLHRHLFQSCLT